MKPRYTRLPAESRRAREAEEAAAREILARWPWYDAPIPGWIQAPRFSRLYDAKETPCS